MALTRILPASLLLAVFLLTGCTHTQQVTPEANASISFDELHQMLEGRRVDIRLRDERTMASTALRIRPDSTWSVDLLTGDVRGAATRDIHSITWKRPGRGALEGALLGAAGGAIVGLATGFALTYVRDAETAKTSLGYYVGVITGFGVIVGVGSGTLVGVSKGSRQQYVYPQLPHEAQGPSAPSARTLDHSTHLPDGP